MQNAISCNYGVLLLPENGEVDENAITAFTRGHCHSFALAMHSITGWPIMGVGNTKDSPAHCVVFCPQLNTYIDIEGVGAEYRYAHRFEQHLSLVEPGSIPYLKYYRDPEPETAMPFVKTVLQSLNVEIECVCR